MKISANAGVLVGLFLLAALIALTSCSNTVTGSGDVIAETRDVHDFNRVSLNGIGSLRIEQGTSESLRIVGENNIISRVRTDIINNELTFSYEEAVVPTKPLDFFLTVKDLQAINLSGLGTTTSTKLSLDRLNIISNGSGEVDLAVEAKELMSIVSGSAKIRLSGRADKQRVDITGSGKYDAEGLTSNGCEIKINGAGSAIVDVRNKLDIEISGNGKVFYAGNPAVNQQISGTGTIRKVR